MGVLFLIAGLLIYLEKSDCQIVIARQRNIASLFAFFFRVLREPADHRCSSRVVSLPITAASAVLLITQYSVQST